MIDLYDSWLKRDTSSTEAAAFIFNGKDSRLYKSKFRFPVNDNDFSGVKPNTWQWDVLETYYILEAADWEKYVDVESDYNFHFRHPKKASPSAFMSLAEDKRLKLPAELLEKWKLINSHAKDHEKTNKTESELSTLKTTEGTDKNHPQPQCIEDAFDPLPTDSIARMFKVEKEEEKNIAWWRGRVGEAKKFGLSFAIVKTGEGSAQSTLNPYLAGEWLIQKEKWEPRRVYRILAGNLPPRSADSRDDLMLYVDE